MAHIISIAEAAARTAESPVPAPACGCGATGRPDVFQITRFVPAILRVEVEILSQEVTAVRGVEVEAAHPCWRVKFVIFKDTFVQELHVITVAAFDPFPGSCSPSIDQGQLQSHATSTRLGVCAKRHPSVVQLVSDGLRHVVCPSDASPTFQRHVGSQGREGTSAYQPR